MDIFLRIGGRFVLSFLGSLFLLSLLINIIILMFPNLEEWFKNLSDEDENSEQTIECSISGCIDELLKLYTMVRDMCIKSNIGVVISLLKNIEATGKNESEIVIYIQELISILSKYVAFDSKNPDRGILDSISRVVNDSLSHIIEYLQSILNEYGTTVYLDISIDVEVLNNLLLMNSCNDFNMVSKSNLYREVL